MYVTDNRKTRESRKIVKCERPLDKGDVIRTRTAIIVSTARASPV